MISQQFKFVGRGRHEKLKEFNARINYILRQMTRDSNKLPENRAREGTAVNPPEALIITSKQGMIDAAVITFYTNITDSEPRFKESQEAEKEAEAKAAEELTPDDTEVEAPADKTIKPAKQEKPTKK